MRIRKAFTLVEMLLVIAIIALLSVMLLAALRSARSTGRLAQCMANVKNLGAGMHAFAVRNKSYGMPGAPNSFCASDGTGGGTDPNGNPIAGNKSGQQAGVAPNTLWTGTPQTGDMQPATQFLPLWGYIDGSTGFRASRFVNHGFLYKGGEVNDERSYYCPDMEGLYTADPGDVNSFNSSIQPYLAATDPANTTLNPAPAAGLAWMSSYDYRSCYDPGVPLYNGTNVNWDSSNTGDRAADYKGPYGPINLGKLGAESPVFADTIQNPGGLKVAHENRRYNVVYADGHGTVFQDDARAVPLGTAAASTALVFPPDPVTGNAPTTIASLNLSIASTSNYWYWNERVWVELFARP